MKKQNKIVYNYYGDSKDIFSLLKDYDWPIYLCSNHDTFKNQRYDIITCMPIQKIYAFSKKTIVETKDTKKVYFDDPIEVLNKIGVLRIPVYKSSELINPERSSTLLFIHL